MWGARQGTGGLKTGEGGSDTCLDEHDPSEWRYSIGNVLHLILFLLCFEISI